MSTWNIYHKDGSKLTDVNGEQITVHGLEYSDSWMGECFVTINFKHEVPINFQIGDYIVYRGERFELNYEPGKDKQARPDTYGEGFVYDSVKFNALQDELARAEFLDVVLNDNELHYTSLPKFPFFVQTLDDLLDRIQANLNEQIGAGLWKIYSRNKDRSVQRGALESEWLSVYGEKTEDNVIESMSITVDSQTCWQALALVNEKWDINFIVRGRNIYVGTTGIEAGHIFSYGLGKGLYEIVQNADSDQSVITRLRAYGSEKNLLSHYYADLGIKYVANITKVIGASTNVELELDIDYIETYFKNKRKYVVSGESQEQSNGWVLQVTFDFQTTITGYVTQSGSSGKCRFYSELKGGQVDSGDEESKEKLDAFIAQVNAGNTKMYITSGLNKKVVPSSMKEYAKNLPNNMSINRLMLPGFPHVSLSDFYDSLTEQEKKYVNPTGKLHKFSTDPYRPYIDSLNIEEIGLRSASQFFDTDDKTNGVIEIYPTIEEMEIGGVRVDEIDEGVAPDDDGRFGDNETVKNIDIYLNKAIDFDINDLKDDDFSISMKDGMCGGRTFKVASSTKVDGRWRLTIERSKDDALELWFPYKDYPIKSGDHFVLTGITLPDSYVNAASLKLLKYAIALLDKNDYTRYVYQPKVDELFMARQHDKAQADETGTIKSLHDTLKAGDLMNFNDTDLNIEGIISIDQLTIKEEDGKIPTYDITLREDKEVGTIQKIQQQISSLQSGNGGAGLTTTQVKNQVATEGSKHFISKINDDTAKGTITWGKVQKLLSGLLVGNFNNENGGSWTPDAEGRSHLITDYLEVRMKAIFEELVIKKTSTIGGKEIISPAGGVVVHKMEEVTVTYNNVSQKAYRCYFLAEQEGDAVDNDFAIGDQVRSESFNVRKGTYHKVGNHFYWRLVIGRDEEPVELEGKKYHYIDLSDTDCATASDVPAKGDVLSQCGNRTDVERQNCLIFSAVDTYSPSVSLYHGINSYSFANKEYVEYGVNKQTNKAFFNVYGDMYVGDRPTKENGYEGSSYIKYDSAAKQVSVKGKISAKSTVDGKELSQYIKENSAKGLTEEQVNNIIKNSQVIADLQNQVDGAIETWFYDGVPTLSNKPASDWKTDKDKNIHLGDLYYDNKTGKAYRFAKDGNTYKWTIITDTDIAKALSDAAKAQETADGKMKVFSTQPIPPYQLGDIWVNATYPTDGSIYKNEILRCQTAKAKGSSFAIADWTKASKYTDDSALNTFKEEYKNDMASYKEQLDEKVETWFYNYAPTTQNKPASDWTTDTLKSQHAGDLFYNTSKGYTYRWTGTAWARIKDNDINTAMTAASKAQDTADGKRTVFTSQPTVPYDEGDLWASGGDDGKTLMVCIKGRTTGSFTSSEWVKANDSDLNAFAKTIEESLNGIRDQLDKKAETWYQPSDPSASWTTDDAKKEHKGDLWYNTSNNQTFFWNGTKWDKQDVPTEVFDKIDGKSSIYVSKPASYEERDLWILEAAYTLGGVAYSKGELVVATKTNASFSADDWTKKVKYTDDTVANAAKTAAEKAQKAAEKAQGDITKLGTTVTDNKKAFDNYVTDGYLEPSEIAAMAQDSKRLEDAFAAAEKSYTEVKGAEVLANTKELTDLKTAFATLTTAKTELVTYLSDISARYNKADTNGKATIVSAVGTKFTNFQGAYSAFYDKLGLANAYITSKIYGDLKQNITDLAGYKYIKDALGQTTDIDGGLVMTTLLALRDADGNVQSGINGAIDPNRGKKSIATWWGGRMVDKDYNSGNLTPATSLVRFDGSGYLANGAIWWDVDGKVHADPTSFIISEKNLGAYLTFFEPTWKSGSAGTSVADLVSLKPNAPFSKLGVSGDATFEGAITFHGIKLTYDATNKAIKIDGNLYATGGITAYGAGTSTSTGGGLNGSVKSYSDALKLTSESLSEVASAYSIKQLSTRITSLEGGSATSISVSGSGNAVTSVTKNGTTISVVKGATFLTSHQSLSAYLKSADAANTYSKIGHTHDHLTTPMATNGTLNSGSNNLQAIYASGGNELSGKPSNVTAFGVLRCRIAEAWSGQIMLSIEGNLYTRVGNNENFDSSLKWRKIIDSSNIGSQSVHYATSAGSANSVAWSNVSGRPTKVSQFTNDSGYITSSASITGNAATATKLQTARKLWGNSFNGTADINGSIIVPSGKYISIGNIKLEYDAANKALKITNTTTEEVANLYTSGGVSAYGVGTSSSSGGGFNGSVKSYSNALKLTSESLSEIASAYSIKALDSRISSLEGGSAMDVSVSGSGNAVTAISKSGTTIIVTKGTTFLTSHQSLASYLTKTDAASLYQPKGNYLTAHQSLDGYVNAIAVSGSGNAVTAVTKSGKTITFTKGATYLTSHQSLSNYYTKSSVDSLLSGKSATSHTHSVKINGVTKTIAATGGTAVDLGTYLTSHQSLADYAKKSEIPTKVSQLTNDTGYITSSGSCAYATKLQTPRTIWGQSFDGTGNVSGLMKNVRGLVYGNSFDEDWSDGNNTHPWYGIDYRHCVDSAETGKSYTSISSYFGLYFKTGGSNFIFDGGNVGIGTTAPSHKLHVSGEIYTTTKVNINGIVLEKDSNGNLKVNGNLYATGGISAYGTSSAGSGGGLSGSVLAWDSAIKMPNATNGSSDTTKTESSFLASAWSIKQLYNKVTNLEGGSAMNVSVSGSGNAVTSISKSGTTISVVKGSTFLTAHQSLAGYMKTATADAKYMYHSRNNIVSDLNSFATNGAAHIYEMNNVTNRPNSNSWVQVMNWGTGDSAYGFLLANDYSTNGHMYFRQKIAGSWKDWKTIIDSSNIGSQSVNYAASAGSVAWTNVSGRPSTMKNPSALSWSGYSSGSYDGSAAKSISIPNNTNQLTNGAGFITASASITGNAATATKVNHSLSVFGKSFNGSADVTVADTDLIASISTATANLTDKTEILTSYASDNGFNDSNSKNRIYRRPASAIWGYINSKTISNADKLDNVHLNGIFTALSNTNNGVSMTIGTVAKSLANMQVYSATKLVTARNIALNGDLMGNANFDGSANITINGYMSYCNATVSNTNTYPWRRIAKVNELTGNYSDGCILLYISEGFNGGYYGIARVYIRTDNLSTGANASCSIQWISRNGYGLDSLKIAMYKTTGKAYYDVFLKMRGAYASVVIRTLQDQRGGLGKRFTLVNSTETTNAASHTEAYATIEDAATAIHNQAYTSIAQGSDVATVHNADMVDGIHASGLFTNLSNNGNNLSITIGGTNKTLTVGYATKAAQLNTARTLWGQSFDGTGNVNGTLINTNSAGSETIIRCSNTNGQIDLLTSVNRGVYDRTKTRWLIGTNGANSWLDCGNVGIGTTAPAYKLDVSGDARATNFRGALVGNATTATKLQTARTIWGQSFNGTANVSGSITGVNNITMSNNSYLYGENTGGTAIQLIAMASWNSVDIGRGALTYGYTTQVMGKTVALTASDDSGKNTKSVELSTAKLYSNVNIETEGGLLAHGGVTAYSSSDIRLKQDLRKLDYLGIIKAMGGTFSFAWKKDNTRSIGWIAQHVLCNPHLKDIVETDEKGYYKINYWSPKLIATAFGAIEQVGDEVSRLKARVVFLESEVQRLSGKQDGNNKKRLDNKNINLLN